MNRSLPAWTFAALVLSYGGRAAAQEIPPIGQSMREIVSVPSDCRSLLPTNIRGTVQPWQSFVRLEHCDRIKRLRRLSTLLPIGQQPRFFEDVVPASRLPREFGVDMPVLRVVFPDRTFFDTSDVRLRPEAAVIVSLVASSLRGEPPDVALFIAGHADERGERGYNEQLSIGRSDAIATAIFRQGTASSSIWRIGFGEDMPLVSGHTPFAWDRNRRVEFLFAAKPEAVATWLADRQLEGLCQAQTASEVASCRQRLSFRDGYDAEEMVATPPTAVAPRGKPKVKATLRRPGRTSVTAAGNQADTASVNPGTSDVGVDPQARRRIRIDPINRRAPRVRIDL